MHLVEVGVFAVLALPWLHNRNKQRVCVRGIATFDVCGSPTPHFTRTEIIKPSLCRFTLSLRSPHGLPLCSELSLLRLHLSPPSIHRLLLLTTLSQNLVHRAPAARFYHPCR